MSKEAGDRSLILAETLVVIAIILVMGGIVYTGSAPLREKARAGHCLANLHRISKAIQMYRQDYGGGDPPEALTYSQLGLPESEALLVPTYIDDPRVFKCPSEYFPGRPVQMFCSYIWRSRSDDVRGSRLEVPSFSRVVATRGRATPIVVDVHHGNRLRAPRQKPYSILVVRLSGEVQRRVVTTPNSWDW